ncbi:hypothetical protein [Aeromonas sanarellii]|uniref:hypothetical protein n=1 Tax=Aeromonas sanarellii TaxID=633415 RepID=UPI0038D0C03E
MAKKITISELLIKIEADTKNAVRDIKNLDKLSQQVGKKQTKQKQKEERIEKENAKEAATRLRHQERMQLASHRAKLKQEDILLREKLRNGERIRRQELANHRKTAREQQQREKAARNQNKPQRRGNGGGVGAGGVAVGVAAGTAFNASISGAINNLINTMTDLFHMAKERAISKEQIGFSIYSAYKDKGATDTEAGMKAKDAVASIQKISNEQGASFASVGKTYQAILSAGATSEEANAISTDLFKEIRAMGLGEEATKAIARELNPLFMGSGISAESVNTLEEWNALPLVANLLGLSVKELSKISKDGELNAKTQGYTLKQLQHNLNEYGNAKYAPEYFKEDSVTKASQELDAAINRLKDVFSIHASSGIADALNSLADVLAKKETQQAIINAGESFGAIIGVLSGLLTEFINTGGLQTLTEVFSKENIKAVATGFGRFIDILGRLIDWLEWILPDSKPEQKPVKPDMSTTPTNSFSNPETSYGYRPEQSKPEQSKPVEINKVSANSSSNAGENPYAPKFGVQVEGKGNIDFGDLLDNIHHRTKVEVLQNNIQESLAVSKVALPMLAPSTTTNSSSVTNSNNVVNNVTHVHGDVTKEFAEKHMGKTEQLAPMSFYTN